MKQGCDVFHFFLVFYILILLFRRPGAGPRAGQGAGCPVFFLFLQTVFIQRTDSQSMLLHIGSVAQDLVYCFVDSSVRSTTAAHNMRGMPSSNCSRLPLHAVCLLLNVAVRGAAATCSGRNGCCTLLRLFKPCWAPTAAAFCCIANTWL